MTTAKQRKGMTTTETIVVLVLLGVVVTSVGKFAAFVSQGVRDRQLALRLQWELENAREVISSWPTSEVTRERIEQIAISPELEESLEEPQWVATLTPQVLKQQNESAAIEVTSVHLQLNARYRGQQIKPVQTFFWILPDSKMQSTSDSSFQKQPAGEEAVL